MAQQTTASAAVREAERLIAEAKTSGATRLELRNLEIEVLPTSLVALADQLKELIIIGCPKLSDIGTCCELKLLVRLAVQSDPDLILMESNVSGIPSLGGLTRLQSLDLSGCPRLTSVQGLRGLIGLQALNLSGCRELKDLDGLRGLASLKTLDLSLCSKLQDVSALQGLPALQVLDLHSCGALTNVNGLQGMASLQRLDLSTCRALTDVSALQCLKTLRTLDLSFCSSLRSLHGLQGLTSLHTLDLHDCVALSDLTALQDLTGLLTVDLNSCKALNDVTALKGLTGLSGLSTVDGPAVSVGQCFPLVPSDGFHALNALYADRLFGAPSELASTNLWDNCLPRLQAWRDDLAQGRAEHSELKLFVLGNGRVGKTQICRRLRGEAFDPGVPSTHGIQLGEHPLQLGREGPVTLRFWDFGGQDIYLGTHALFLDDRAIYLIAWHPDSENTAEEEHNGVVMRNRPLAYWLAYVRSLAGPKAQVLLVQTRCDDDGDATDAPLPPDHGFGRLPEIQCSSNEEANPDGMGSLLLELKKAVRAQLKEFGRVPMPQSWADVGHTLSELREVQGRKTIPRDEFDTLCRDRHGVTAPGVVLDYLHRGGQVFWNQGAFGGEIVLQLDWALDGIYAVLHRERTLPLLQDRAGLFTPALLAAMVWQDRPEGERELLLSMMKQCQIVFEVADGYYVAPAALPDQQADKVRARIKARWHRGDAEAAVCLGYGFLHEGVLRTILCEVGRQAGTDAVYWQYGLCMYDEATDATLYLRSELPDVNGPVDGKGGCIVLEAKGGRANVLVTRMVRSIQAIRIGAQIEVSWFTGAEADEAALSSDDSGAEASSFASLRASATPRPPGARLPVYVSYAWGGESENLVNQVEQRMRKAGIDFKRDRTEMRPGDWISDFMDCIGCGDVVLVVLSEKYLKSRYCMQELRLLHMRSLGKKRDMLARVVVHVPTHLRIDSEPDRHAYASYWFEQEKRYQVLPGGPSLSPAGREEWLSILEFMHRTTEILSWASDTLMPRGVEGLDAICELLARRAVASATPA